MRTSGVFLFLFLVSVSVIAQPVPPGAPSVVITEILYDLPGIGESLEFIEVKNPSDSNERGLTGYRFTEGIEFNFPSGLIAQPDEFFIIAKDSVAFENAFGIPAFQWTSGDLSDEGETIILKNNFNITSDSVPYSNTSPWPSAGNGTSIAMCIDTTDGSNPQNWAAVTNNTGIIVDGVEIHASPGEECSIDNSILQVANDAFQIFPNPNNGSFYLNAASAKGVISIEVLSSSGQLVHAQSVNGNTSISIDLSNGVYLVRSLFGGQLYHQRLVVVR